MSEDPQGLLANAHAVEQKLSAGSGNVATQVPDSFNQNQVVKRGRPPKSEVKAVEDPAVSSDMSRLAQLEAELLKAREELAAKDAELAARDLAGAVRPSEKVTVGEGYKFLVRPIDPKDSEGVVNATKEIVCCDESEAKRWYCITTKDPVTQKQWDPVAKELVIECLEKERRAKNIQRRKYEAYVLAKGDAKERMTESEEAIYKKLRGFDDIDY